MRRLALILAPLLLFVALVGQKLSSPDDLDVLDQGKMSLYVIDIFHNGHWLVPLERGEAPTTKPPLQPWIATVASYASGGPTELALRVPAILSALGVLLLTLSLGRRFGSPELGAIAAVALVTNFLFLKLATLARPDMLHAFCTTLALYLVVRAIEAEEAEVRARRFWLGAFAALGAACLAKSPVSLLLLPVTVLLWAALSGQPGRRLLRRIPIGPGLAITVAVALAWLVPATLRNRPLVDVLWSEFSTHVGGDGANMGRNPVYLLPHFFQKFLPWSLFLVLGVVEAIRRRFWTRMVTGPNVPETARLPEEPGIRDPWAVRLLAASVLATVLVFSVFSQKRSDYVLPAWPAAALLVGHLITRGAGLRSVRVLGWIVAPLAVGGAIFMFVYLDREQRAPFIPEPYLQPYLAHLGPICALVALAGLGAFVAARGWRRPGLVTAGLALATACGLAIDFAWLSRIAVEKRGGAIREFCARARERAREAPEALAVGGTILPNGASDVSDSLLFYLDKPGKPLGALDAARAVREGKVRYLVVSNSGRREIEKLSGPPLAVLDETPPYAYDWEERYYLISKAP